MNFFMNRNSKFGVSRKEMLSYVVAYGRLHCEMSGIAASIDTTALPKGDNGETIRIFDTDDKFQYYRVSVSDKLIDGADRDMSFVHGLLVMGHELGHIEQFESKDVDMALCKLASACNQNNYRDNYRFNICEVDAERQGFKMIRTYLNDEFPDADPDSMMLAYVNSLADPFGTRDEDRRYFIMKPKLDPDIKGSGEFRSMDEVEKAFDAAYEHAKDHVNKYVYKPSENSFDAFAILTGMRFNDKFDDNWRFMFDALSNAKDARESNIVLASAGLYLYPGDIREAIGAGIPDLCIRAVFGRDAPPGKVSTMRYAPSVSMRSMGRDVPEPSVPPRSALGQMVIAMAEEAVRGPGREDDGHGLV